MNDLISRQDAIKAVHEEFDECTVWDESGETTADEVERILDRVPSAQHTAVWELDEQQEHVEKIWHCSNCGYRAWGSYEKTDFCGGCGARMEGIDE